MVTKVTLFRPVELVIEDSELLVRRMDALPGWRVSGPAGFISILESDVRDDPTVSGSSPHDIHGCTKVVFCFTANRIAEDAYKLALQNLSAEGETITGSYEDYATRADGPDPHDGPAIEIDKFGDATIRECAECYGSGYRLGLWEPCPQGCAIPA